METTKAISSHDLEHLTRVLATGFDKILHEMANLVRREKQMKNQLALMRDAVRVAISFPISPVKMHDENQV